MWRGLVLLSAALVAAPGSAHAGRTFYGWLYGSEVMPQRAAELQSWISDENRPNASFPFRRNVWTVTAQVGVTDQLELGFPTEFEWLQRTEMMTTTTLTRWSTYGIEARYRFVTQDPVDAPALVPLVRVGMKRLIGNRDAMQPELDFVLSYETGIVHVLMDLGFTAVVDAEVTAQFRPGAGISVLVVEDLRVGAEAFVEVKTDTETEGFAGPNVSWTHGRFWVSGVLGMGKEQSRLQTAARVQWGLAF